MENTPQNPLNTGNGVPSTNPTPTPPKPAAPVNITPGTAPSTPVTSPTGTPVSPLEKIMAMKKYIIMGVGAIALLVSVYMAYSYYTGISEAVDIVKDEAKDLNNKLTTPATDTPKDEATKKNDTVNKLKEDVKKNDSNTSDSSNPPGIKINGGDIQKPSDSSEKPGSDTLPKTNTDSSTDTSSNTALPGVTTDSLSNTAVPR